MLLRRAPPSAQFLAAELERARVVSPVGLPPNVISMHSAFDFRDGITDQVRRAMLVYPGEEDGGMGRISVLSPLGAAFRPRRGLVVPMAQRQGRMTDAAGRPRDPSTRTRGRARSRS
jgi:hypothetical protein